MSDKAALSNPQSLTTQSNQGFQQQPYNTAIPLTAPNTAVGLQPTQIISKNINLFILNYFFK